MTESEILSIRLGSLAAPLTAAAEAAGKPRGKIVREAIAAYLAVDEPELAVGNPNLAEQSAAGVAARWGKRRKRKK